MKDERDHKRHRHRRHLDEDLAPYFLEIGMHCLGCPSARSETVEEACQVHGVDADELVKKLNAALAGK